MKRKCDKFFNDLGSLKLTFDEVRLLPDESDVISSEVDLRTKISRRVPLHIPVVGAAMDTVTEEPMAIALAKAGGLGILHRNNTAEEQALMVYRVKHHLNAFLDDPKTVKDSDKIIEIKELIKRYDVDSFPVVNSDKKVVGVITGHDISMGWGDEVTASEIMSSDLITIPGHLPLRDVLQLMRKSKKKIIPVINPNGELAGIYTLSDVVRIVEDKSRIFNLDANGNLRVGAAIGIGEKGLRRAELCAQNRVDVLVIDAAHADTKLVYQLIGMLKEIKRTFPDVDIVAGNVSTGQAALRLAKAGVDGIKVGQGPGSICKTRTTAGIGVPQLSAIYDCEFAIRGRDIPIGADGGIKYSGDVAIALGSGAHYVMVGNVIAGTEECPGETFVDDRGNRFKIYRGMGSKAAMKGGLASDRYVPEEAGDSKRVSEGVVGRVPCKGKVADIIFEFVGGLSQGMFYTGARTIEDLRQKADFIRMTPAGMAESLPHSITIVEGSPLLCRV